MKARGNRIGAITDLKTSCLAAGRPDLAYKLVEQLQNALDSLKHKVEIDESVVSDIQEGGSAGTLAPLQTGAQSIGFPAISMLLIRTRLGRLYNVLRKEIGFLPTRPATV